MWRQMFLSKKFHLVNLQAIICLCLLYFQQTAKIFIFVVKSNQFCSTCNVAGWAGLSTDTRNLSLLYHKFFDKKGPIHWGHQYLVFYLKRWLLLHWGWFGSEFIILNTKNNTLVKICPISKVYSNWGRRGPRRSTFLLKKGHVRSYDNLEDKKKDFLSKRI